MSQFWQNTQRRLHRPKKIVPEPRQPRRQSSSPKCGKALETIAWRPVWQAPVSPEDPVAAAVARTGLAALQLPQGGFDAGGESALPVQAQVGGLELVDEEAFLPPRVGHRLHPVRW